MKCYKCGAELGEGMTFCPSCGAAQNMQQPNGQEQQWQPQQPNGQYQQQYGQQQYQGWAQNNVQYSAAPNKKKSRTPLIIGLVAAVVVVIGLAVTLIILLTSKGSSSDDNKGSANSKSASEAEKVKTAEDAVEGWLGAILDGDFTEALEYYHPCVIDYYGRSVLMDEFYDVQEALSTYSVNNTENLSSGMLDEINNELTSMEYDEAEKACRVEVYLSGDGHSGLINLYVIKTGGKWYLFGVE